MDDPDRVVLFYPEAPEPARLGAGDAQIAPAHPAVIGELLFLHAVGRLEAFRAPQAAQERQVQKYRELGPDTARGDPAQLTKAAKVLSYVIIGVAVSILAFSIIAITKQLMGL